MAVKYPAPSPPFIRARYHGGRQTPRAIVMHGTVSSDNRGTARNIALWWNGPSSPKSSAHYIVDPGQVIQTVGDHTVAYHCGYNTGSIAVELCDEQQGPASRWEDADSRAILARAARLVAQLCLAYGISAHRPSVAELKRSGPHGIYGHNDSRLAFGGTTHTDPRDFDWPSFLRLVRKEIAAIKAETNGLTKANKKPFKILHAPLHGSSATNRECQAALGRKGVVGVAFSEAYKKGDWAKRRPVWRAVVGGTRHDPRGRMVERDVILLVRRFRKKRESGIQKVANAADPLKIAPERYMVWSVDNIHGLPLAHISLHPHAAVKQRWDSRRAEEYRKSMMLLQAKIVQLRKKYGKDLDIVVTGDLNYGNVDDNRYWTPRHVFDRLGLKFVNRGVDWVAHSDSLRRTNVKVIRDNGQDHPWIEVEFRRR